MKKKIIAVFLLVVVAGILYFWISHNSSTKEEIKPSSLSSADQVKVSVKNQEFKNQTHQISNKHVKEASKKVQQSHSLTNIDSYTAHLLQKIKNNDISSISREDMKNLIDKLKNLGEDNGLIYQAILDLYKSDITDESKIFLVNILSETNTYESVVALTTILDLDNANQLLIDANKQAIQNIVSSNTTDTVNSDTASALMQYFDRSDNETYKPIVATSILQIGSFKESDHLISRLNDPSDEDEIEYIRNAMNNIKSEEMTSLVYKKYNTEDSSEILKDAAIDALSHIANRTAALALYSWSSKTSDVDAVKRYFGAIKSQNPATADIIREELYSNAIEFESDNIKDVIARVLKSNVDSDK